MRGRGIWRFFERGGFVAYLIKERAADVEVVLDVVGLFTVHGFDVLYSLLMRAHPFLFLLVDQSLRIFLQSL